MIAVHLQVSSHYIVYLLQNNHSGSYRWSASWLIYIMEPTEDEITNLQQKALEQVESSDSSLFCFFSPFPYNSCTSHTNPSH